MSIQIRNAFSMRVLVMTAIVGFFTGAQAADVTPQEINAKECKKYVDSLFDEFPDFPQSKYLNRESAVRTCTNEMNNNYRNGLPCYATHTPRDVENYREEKRKKDALAYRARSQDTLDRIQKSCARPIFNIYVDMYAQKTKGISKEDQVKVLRAQLHSAEPNTILDGILMGLSYKALDEIYSTTGPTTDTEAAYRVVAFHKKCTEMYEQALFLR